MTFMEETIHNSLAVWDACMQTKFIKEMQAGTLPMEKFAFYLIQDTLYLNSYAKVLGKAIYLAENLNEIQLYTSILSFVTDTEAMVRHDYLHQLKMA